MEESKRKSLPKGFTFTISIILLSITLVGMALFSQEWRKTQKTTFTELLPAEIARIEEKVSSDLSSITSAQLSVKNAYPYVQLDMATFFPYKKEGLPIADMNSYLFNLPENLRNTGAEAILISNINGSNATIINISSGSLVYSNDGPYDVATFFHPLGWQPIAIYANISCGKRANSIGNFMVSGGMAGSDNLYYALAYSDLVGVKNRFTNTPVANHQATLSVSYPDGTSLRFVSNFSSGLQKNYTSIYFTKSPSGALILPLDSPPKNNQIRDYSEYGNHFYAGNLGVTFEPACKIGGCLSFSGSQYLKKDSFSLTDSELSFPLGAERMTNGNFEDISGPPPNIWPGWAVTNPTPDEVYIGYALTPSTGFAALISNPAGYAGIDYTISQQITNLYENTFYTLSFLFNGSNGSYSIYDPAKNKYLRQDGSWATDFFAFETGATSSFSAITKEFVVPAGSSQIILTFFGANQGDVYYDSVSLRESSGLNGGFEQYYQIYAPGGGAAGVLPE
ncbi:MAG: hypothetical protein N3G80_02195 [Candidatus Micrarchaeota archaeon]|nr:hypothetical protein [Candidatus Micrarchaeota archaeon]